MVPGSFLLFPFRCCGGVGVGTGSGADRAVTHSVGYADVDEKLPVVNCGVDVHYGLLWCAVIVNCVKFWYVLFALTEEPHLDEPVVEYITEVVVFDGRLPPDLARECVVSLWVEWMEACAFRVGVLA